MATLRPWTYDPTSPGHRVLHQPISASILPKRPGNIPKSRGRGAKAEGRRYEAAVLKKLLLPLTKTTSSEVLSSVWFEFLDANGRGVCEADHIIIRPDRVVVVECKLTQTPRGISQLERLYLPCARLVWPERRVQGVMICKTLYEEPTFYAGSWEEVLAAPDSVIPTWHWLGR